MTIYDTTSLSLCQAEEERALADERRNPVFKVKGWLSLFESNDVRSHRTAELMEVANMKQAEQKLAADLEEVQSWLDKRDDHAERQAEQGNGIQCLIEPEVFPLHSGDWTCSFCMPDTRRGKSR